MKKLFCILFTGFGLFLLSEGVAKASCTCTVSPSGDKTGAQDRAAIEDCITDFNSSGGLVVLDAGPFYIDSAITLVSNLTIKGAGASSTLLYWVTDVSAKSYLFGYEDSASGLSQVTIKDLTIDGQNNWIIGIKVDGGSTGGRASQVTISDAEIVNCGEYGIHIKQTDGIFMSDVTLEHNGFNSYEKATRYEESNIYALNHNIYLRHVTNALIENVETIDAAGNGMNVSDTSSDIVLNTVTANYNGQNGIRFADSDYVKIAASTTASYNGKSLSDGSTTCYVDDGLCNGIEFRTEDDGDSATYDGVTYGCVKDSIANDNHSYWLYIKSASSYELDNNTKSGNDGNDGVDDPDCTTSGGDTKCVSSSSPSSSTSGICSKIPRDDAVWPFDQTGYNDPGTASTDCDNDGSDATADGGNDCDDTIASIYSGAPETCGDGIDQDCDGVDSACDSDGDGVTDGSDNCPSAANSDQTNTDSDSEGDACDSDDDNDGLSDGDETARGTYPNDSDSDDDTLSDGAEVNTYGTNPLNSDTDGDGSSDGDEVSLGYDPLTYTDIMTPILAILLEGDDDGDGYDSTDDGGEDCDDGEEAVYPGATEACDGVDNDCDGDVDPDCDNDGDGLTNSQEIAAGSNPDDAASTACVPPSSGTDWTVSRDCTLFQAQTWNGDVYVQDGAIVIIPTGMTLDLDFLNQKLVVEDESGVLIQQGGTLH